jgi:hypothetical protein
MEFSGPLWALFNRRVPKAVAVLPYKSIISQNRKYFFDEPHPGFGVIMHCLIKRERLAITV